MITDMQQVTRQTSSCTLRHFTHTLAPVLYASSQFQVRSRYGISTRPYNITNLHQHTTRFHRIEQQNAPSISRTKL